MHAPSQFLMSIPSSSSPLDNPFPFCRLYLRYLARTFARSGPLHSFYTCLHTADAFMHPSVLTYIFYASHNLHLSRHVDFVMAH